MPPEITLEVAILAERRPGVTIWQSHVWRALAVLEEAPPVPAWTKLREESGREVFFAGTAEITLHRTDTPNYKENLEAAEPLVWVVLRDSSEGMTLGAVTVDPGEGEIYTEAPSDLVEALPMPPGLRALLGSFVAAHHVEREFHKRKRDRQDTDSLGRKGRV
ncbi:MAG: DUF3305 domain-containing protein [Roseococcus sp.]|nr:DUF3305 domain-containing protein [Roseococcus sp.]